MVKIPSLDELKKMGSGLLDQAKTVKFGEMVDKVKSGIDSVSGKKPPTEFSNETLKTVFQNIYTALSDLTQAQSAQITAVKKIEANIEQLAKVIEVMQPSTVKKPEDTPSE